MNFEPQKFFIGLMDFFSILLPGALLTYLLMGEVGPAVLGCDNYEKLDGTEAWAVFFFASYLLGHLIFLLGAWLLDDLYDRFRNYTLNTQISRLAHRDKLLNWFTRLLVWLVFKQERNLAVDRAASLKKQALAPLQAKDSINTFQWCKVLLTSASPDCLAAVHRFEADSKFFRSFAVVLILIAAGWHFQDKWPSSGFWVVLVLLFLALWRYMEQRFKSTNQAYWSVITISAKDGKVVLDKDDASPAAKGLTHAGGVVYRMRCGQAQYLLVEAKDDPRQWVLPKGHIEPGEHPRETAVREVHEETGVWGRIIEDLGTVSFTVEEKVITPQFFLMEYAGRGLRQEASREHQWFPYEEAKTKASHIETRDLLKSAEPNKIPELLKLAEARRARL